MDSGQIVIVALIAVVVGFIGHLKMCSSILKKTGKDLSGGFIRKLLIVVAGFGAMSFIGIEEMEKAEIMLAIGIIAIGYLLLLLYNKKYITWGTSALLSAFQTAYGAGIVIVFILKMVCKFMGMEFGQPARTQQAKFDKKQIDEEIIREENVDPVNATPQAKDDRAREKGYNSYAELEKNTKED